MSTLPAVVNSGVSPMERPEVPNADMDSKSTARNSAFSVTDNNIVAMTTNISDINVIVTAL
ncbi:hypothetical protein D3C78_1577150 [compost metagenome]